MRGRVLLGAGAMALLLVAGAPPATAQAPSADLSISGLAFTVNDVQPAMATGVVTVRNLGPDSVTNLVVTFELPAGVGYLSGGIAAQPTCTFDAATGAVTCALGGLPAAVETNAVVVVANTGQAAGVGVAVAARVASSATDPNPGNNVTSGSLTFGAGPPPTIPGGGPAADLVLGPPQPTLWEGQLLVAFEVVNAGPSRAEAVVLRFTLPAEGRFLRANLATGPCTYDEATRVVACPMDALDAAGTTSGAVAVDPAGVAPGQVLQFTAELTSATADPLPVNNQQTYTYVVPGGPAATSVAPTPATTSPEPMPATGGDTSWPVVVAGAAALLAGTALLVLARPGPGKRHRRA